MGNLKFGLIFFVLAIFAIGGVAQGNNLSSSASTAAPSVTLNDYFKVSDNFSGQDFIDSKTTRYRLKKRFNKNAITYDVVKISKNGEYFNLIGRDTPDNFANRTFEEILFYGETYVGKAFATLYDEDKKGYIQDRGKTFALLKAKSDTEGYDYYGVIFHQEADYFELLTENRYLAFTNYTGQTTDGLDEVQPAKHGLQLIFVKQHQDLKRHPVWGVQIAYFAMPTMDIFPQQFKTDISTTKIKSNDLADLLLKVNLEEYSTNNVYNLVGELKEYWLRSFTKAAPLDSRRCLKVDLDHATPLDFKTPYQQVKLANLQINTNVIVLKNKNGQYLAANFQRPDFTVRHASSPLPGLNEGVFGMLDLSTGYPLNKLCLSAKQRAIIPYWQTEERGQDYAYSPLAFKSTISN